MSMRLRDGKQICPRCSGDGCYSCRRKGFVAKCPVCANSEPELMTQDQDNFRCMCGATFTRAGEVILTST